MGPAMHVISVLGPVFSYNIFFSKTELVTLKTNNSQGGLA